MAKPVQGPALSKSLTRTALKDEKRRRWSAPDIVEMLRATADVVSDADTAVKLLPTTLQFLRKAADEIELLQADLQLLRAVAGTLATHVKGHLAKASATSPAVCGEWADKVHDTIAGQT